MIPTGQLPYATVGTIVKVYESKMMAGDFEIAGRALLMLKNRLLGITDEAEERESQGK